MLVEQVLAREGLREAYRLYFDGPLFKGVPRGGWFDAQVEAPDAFADEVLASQRGQISNCYSAAGYCMTPLRLEDLKITI